MASKIVFDDGKIVELSKETTERLRKELSKPEMLKVDKFMAFHSDTGYFRLALVNSLSFHWNGITGLETKDIQAHSFTECELQEIITGLTKLLEEN